LDKNKLFDGKRIICIAPCYNELHKIDKIVLRINKSIVDEVLVVDDGSTDNSPETARIQEVNILSHKKTKGVGASIRKVIEYALSKNYDIKVIIAGNNEDNPDEIVRLLKQITRYNYDFVQGSRFKRGVQFKNMPLYRIFAVKLHSILFTLFSIKWVTESTNGFRAFRASLFRDKNINLWQEWLDKYAFKFSNNQ